MHDGQEVLVQVIKDPLGTKGARLTTHVSIPSCYVVYMPGAGTVGVSQRIEEEDERKRLRECVRECARRAALEGAPPGDGPGEDWTPEDGYIVRTAAEGCPEAILEADMAFLRKLWASVNAHAAAVNGPGIVHEDLTLVIRTLRELSATTIERVRIDSHETLARVLDFADRFLPDMSPRIELYTGEGPIFELYAVEDEIQKALHRKVQLKSGGHIVIDQTEAMTTVDVNTGGFVGHRNFEETIFKTNLEAAQTIARQLRLRNLGGIIIIDFIDMGNETHKRQVLRALEKALARDHTRTHISNVSPLGLVEMTRKRTRESLEHVLCDPVSDLQRAGLDQVRRHRVLRNIPRDPARSTSVRYRTPARHRVARGHRPACRRGIGGVRGAGGIHRKAHHAAGREPVLARAIRRRVDVTDSPPRRLCRSPWTTAAHDRTPMSETGFHSFRAAKGGLRSGPARGRNRRHGTHRRARAFDRA